MMHFRLCDKIVWHGEKYEVEDLAGVFSNLAQNFAEVVQYYKDNILSKVISPFYYRNLTRRKKIYNRSNFSSFPQYFQYISNCMGQITNSFVKRGCSIYFFLNSANLIGLGTDISRYFREPLELQDIKNCL